VKEGKEKFEQCLREVNPSDYLDYRQFLANVYQYFKKNETKYSYRQLAEDLGFSRTNVMHLIINGKRPLTLKTAKTISKEMGLNGIEKPYFEKLVKFQGSRNMAERDQLFQELIKLKSHSLNSDKSKLQLEFFSEWYHAVIYEMCFMDEFRSDPAWISSVLREPVHSDEVKASLDLLERLQVIEFDSTKGRHVPTKVRISTANEIKSIAVVRYHQKMIQLGKETLTKMERWEREVSGALISISDEDLPEFKREMDAFLEKLLAKADASKAKNNVYQINLQMFPLIKAGSLDADMEEGES